jgi:tetratricopeptide (TPR) repeat protein
MGQARILALEEMTPDDQRALVRRYYAYIRGGEPDPEQVEAIAKFARGLPIAVTTVVQLWVKHGVEDFYAVKSQVVADLADRLLEGVLPEMRPAFEVAAVLRYFNAESLHALLDDGDADALYAELRRWPFIRPRREGLAVHDTMREMMNEALRVRTPKRYRALHERAAAHYEAQCAREKGQERPILELLYHSLRVDESRGIDALERLFGEAERLWHRELMQSLLKEASQYVLKEPQHRHRLRYLQARVGTSWPERERLYRELLSESLDESMRPAVLRGLGQSLVFQGKSDKAGDCLQQALEISKRLGNPIEVAWTRLELWYGIKDPDESREHFNLALAAFQEAGDEYGMAVAEYELGFDYLNRWQAAEARDAFARSMALHEKLGNRQAAAMARERIGQTYLIDGDFPRATTFKEEALKMFEELQDQWSIAWTLDELATCYRWTGQWQLALAALERAQGIFAEWSDNRETACVVRQGEIYRKQGRLELALDTYQRALNTMPRHGAWTMQEIHAGMGHIHLVHGEFEDALAGYQRAIVEFRDRGLELEAKMVGDLYLGKLYSAQGCWADAIEHYTISLEAARAANNCLHECRALIGICQANYRRGHLEQLEAVVSQAEELGQAYRYHQFLADIHLLRGHIALDKSHADREQFAAAIHSHGTALKEALLYNRYKLDETVQAMISHCHGRGTEGRQVLTALRDFWQTGTDDKGISLLQAECAAREREPGDGSPQVTVVERIKHALKDTEKEDRC